MRLAKPDNIAHKRQRIVAAAERLFTGRRFHEVTTDDIAREAQVSKGTLYRCFTDKDDLLFHTLTAGFDGLCSQLEAQRFDPADPPASIGSSCEAISAFFARRRRVFHMLQAEETRSSLVRGELRQRWQALRSRLVAALGSLLEQAQQAGAIRSDVPATVLAALLLGLLRARARELACGDDDVPIPQLVDLYLCGAGAPTARAASLSETATAQPKAM